MNNSFLARFMSIGALIFYTGPGFAAQSVAEVEKGNVTAMVSNEDYYAQERYLDSLYFSGDFEEYKAAAIATTNKASINVFQQEEVAKNLGWDCFFFGDPECLRMFLDWHINIFQYPSSFEELLKNDVNERKNVHALWMSILESNSAEVLSKQIENPARLLDFASLQNLYLANKLWAIIAIKTNDQKQASEGLDRTLAMLLSLKTSPLSKWRLMREYVVLASLIGIKEHAKANKLLMLAGKLPLQYFPVGSVERRHYLGVVGDHLVAGDVFNVEEYSQLVDQEINFLHHSKPLAAQKTVLISQLHLLQALFCSSGQRAECVLDTLEAALESYSGGSVELKNLQLATSYLSEVIGGLSPGAYSLRARNIVKELSGLRPLNPGALSSEADAFKLAEIGSALISDNFNHQSVDSIFVRSLLQDELDLLNSPWNFYSPRPAVKNHASMLLRYENRREKALEESLDTKLGFHEILNHSVGSRDVIAAFWHYGMVAEKYIHNRKQIYRLETKKAHRQIRAAKLFMDKLENDEDRTGWWDFSSERLSLFSDHHEEVRALSFRDDHRNDADKFPGVVATDVQEWLSDSDAVVYTTLHGSMMHTLCLRKNEHLSKSYQVDRRALELNSRILQLATGRSGPADMLFDRQFPDETASSLYKSLFGQIESCLSDAEHLYWLPSQNLRNLPVAALLTEETSDLDQTQRKKGIGHLPWVIKKHSVTVMASVVSLLTSTNPVGREQLKRDFVGVGDPVLGSPEGREFSTAVATRSAAGMAVSVNQLAPLPNTAAELKTIADEFERSTLLLGPEATEQSVRTNFTSGVSSMSFATHGVISGELGGLNESALVLTPVKNGGTDNDGLLTASEIADMTITTNFVSLSACNTSIYQAQYFAEETQGLTNAFLFAGAQSVMSSRWPVETNTAEQLNASVFKSSFFSEGKYAKALQEAQLQMLSDPNDSARQHPRFWASFVINGNAEVQLYEKASIFAEGFQEVFLSRVGNNLKTITRLRMSPQGDALLGLVEETTNANLVYSSEVVAFDPVSLEKENLTISKDLSLVFDFFIDNEVMGLVGTSAPGADTKYDLVYVEIDRVTGAKSDQRLITSMPNSSLARAKFSEKGDLLIITRENDDAFALTRRLRKGGELQIKEAKFKISPGIDKWEMEHHKGRWLISRTISYSELNFRTDLFGSLENCAPTVGSEFFEVDDNLILSAKTDRQGLFVSSLAWVDESWMVAGSSVSDCVDRLVGGTGAFYRMSAMGLTDPRYLGETGSTVKVLSTERTSDHVEVRDIAQRFDVLYGGAPELKEPLLVNLDSGPDYIKRVNKGRRYESHLGARYKGLNWSIDRLFSGHDMFGSDALISGDHLYFSGFSSNVGFLRRYDLKTHTERCPECGVLPNGELK